MNRARLPFRGLHPGRWWRAEGTRFRCELCPRSCLLSPGQRAFCFVRVGTEDGIALATYGRSSGLCIDPIEKKPLMHFYPGTPVLSFGTAGCNLGCQFCQNWSISTARDVEVLGEQADPDAVAAAAERAGCRSVAFTYNDPVVFSEYAIDTALASRARGLHPVAVTAGYITSQARPEFYSAMDAANIDLKGFTRDFYRKVCLAELQPVLETIEYVVRETKVWVELTTLLIPGLNDSERELGELCAWVAARLGGDVPLHFTAFHPDHRMLDRPHTPLATLLRARRIARDHGLHWVYVGNARDREAESTWCRGCGALLIEREGYTIGRFELRAGRCASCGVAVPGRFDESAGGWGNRRRPMSIPAAR
jgi:pyruvate formate lyase activating enzyme